MWTILCDTVSEAITDLDITPAARSALLDADPPPVTNGIIIEYMVSYNINGSTNVLLMNFTTNDERLRGTVGQLVPFTSYVFTVRACTSVGCGPSSENFTTMTLEDGKEIYSS